MIAPPYLSASCPIIFSVWDYVPHDTYLLQVTWTDGNRWIPSGRWRSRGPKSTRSSIRHVCYIMFKWDAGCATRGIVRSVPSASQLDQGFIGRGFKSDNLIFFSPWTAQDHAIFIGWLRSFVILATHVEISQSQDLHRTAEKARGRTPWSRHDRTAIAVRLSRDRGSFSAESEWRSPTWSDGDQLMTRITIDARWWPDRGVIVAWLSRDHGLFEAKIKANLPQIREPWHRPRESLSRPRKTASTIASNGLKIGPNFSFKTGVFSLLFS